jgi:hypothetical protein
MDQKTILLSDIQQNIKESVEKELCKNYETQKITPQIKQQIINEYNMKNIKLLNKKKEKNFIKRLLSNIIP